MVRQLRPHLGSEGLVTNITGPGDVYLQTKKLREFGDWLWTALEPKVGPVTGAR